MIIEALKICLEENFCEFCGEQFKVNSGTAMGPCHSCDYADIFMSELDDSLVQKMADENIQHTEWTRFRDDGWDILLNCDDDLPEFTEALEGLHPNINWDIRTSSANNDHALEHLDLKIYIIEGKIETDNFAKDIPIYLSRKSCHPDFVFKSVVKSAGIRLNQNCSKDSFLWNRKQEYARYFYASLYNPKEVNAIMDEVTGLTKNNDGDFVRGPARQNREQFINRPRRGRRTGQKKFVLVTEWDPRNPDIAAIIRSNKATLYRDPLNRRLFPEGSVIAGFRRRRNLGSMVAPTRPRRQPRPPRGDGGCRPCPSNRDQIHAWLITTNTVISPWDKRPYKIHKVLTCVTPNLVYYLVCISCPGRPGITPHYTGSALNVKKRIANHKSDMTRGVGKDCGFCEHWARHHRNQLQDLSMLQVYFLDSVADPGRKQDDYPHLKRLEEKWMVTLGSLGTMDPAQGCNKRDDAKAGARNWGN